MHAHSPSSLCTKKPMNQRLFYISFEFIIVHNILIIGHYGQSWALLLRVIMYMTPNFAVASKHPPDVPAPSEAVGPVEGLERFSQELAHS